MSSPSSSSQPLFRLSYQTLSSSSSSSTCNFDIVQLPCLSDNYGYLIHDRDTGQTAAIDTPEASVYQRELDKRGWTLSHIFNTHHHFDHTDGNIPLKTPHVSIYGPQTERHLIPGIDHTVTHDQIIPFGSTTTTIIDVGGHTKGHIAYYFPDQKVIFVGDALFVMGCGRMFEGTPTQFWNSLKRLRELPEDTTVFCAHEYTMGNGKFALSVESGNERLVTRMKEVVSMRSRDEPTVPTTIGIEKLTNPFLRVDVSDEIRLSVGAGKDDSDIDVFAKLRRAKDTFRG